MALASLAPGLRSMAPSAEGKATAKAGTAIFALATAMCTVAAVSAHLPGFVAGSLLMMLGGAAYVAGRLM